MAEFARRSFITGLVALVAAPTIVRAGSLMPVKATLQPNSLLEINRITSEAVRLFQSSNAFLEGLPEYEHEADAFALDVLYGHYPFIEGERWSSEQCRAMMERQVEINETWAADDAKIGTTIRIRLPNDYTVEMGPALLLQEPFYKEVQFIKAKNGHEWEQLLQIPDSLALAAAAVAIAPVVLAKPVTRRFWGK